MKKYIYNWLLKQLAPKYNKEQIKQINKFKQLFRIYFEGYDQLDTPNNPIPIKTFEITDLLFSFKGEMLIVTIVLCRPGILIGKGGKTIDELNTFMLNFNMKVEIQESKLWRNLK